VKHLQCGDCSACCSGSLIGDAYGYEFGDGIPCYFLKNKKCSIYEQRPEVCQQYQCAWSQGLFPKELKPNKSGILVSVENNEGGQYLKVVDLIPNVSYNHIAYIESWCKLNNTFYVRIPYRKVIPIAEVRNNED
jgi:hypothetical protein